MPKPVIKKPVEGMRVALHPESGYLRPIYLSIQYEDIYLQLVSETKNWLLPLYELQADVETLVDGRITAADGTPAMVTIPKGYRTNGASIPVFAWPVIGHPLSSAFLRPALVHDWLCDEAAKSNDRTLRVIGDAFFRHFLKRERVSWWKSTVMWAAVWIWGLLGWLRMPTRLKPKVGE